MITTDMRAYDYFTIGDKNAYGQAVSDKEVKGTIKMAISISSQTVQDNINFKDCTYIGLTTDKSVNDKMVIQYGQEKLKVQYVNPRGRFIQVFLKQQ
jgi:tryptophanase